MHEYRKTRLRRLLTALGLSCGLLISAANTGVTPAPTEARFSGFDALPLKVGLREGGRLAFAAVPHSPSVVAQVTGDLEVISKTCDSMLTVGVRADARLPVSTLSIDIGDHGWMTDIAVGKNSSSPKPIVDIGESVRWP